MYVGSTLSLANKRTERPTLRDHNPQQAVWAARLTPRNLPSDVPRGFLASKPEPLGLPSAIQLSCSLPSFQPAGLHDCQDRDPNSSCGEKESFSEFSMSCLQIKAGSPTQSTDNCASSRCRAVVFSLCAPHGTSSVQWMKSGWYISFRIQTSVG